MRPRASARVRGPIGSSRVATGDDAKTYGAKRLVAREMSDALPVRARIDLALERIRPAMQMDGGDIHLVDWNEQQGLVRVALSGACNGCHMSTMTMTLGVERTLKSLVPEVLAVEAI